MSRDVKQDAMKFIHFIDQLGKEAWLGESRKWWPNFLFHFTDINNAVRILETGKLFSRAKLLQANSMPTDNASPDIINQTDKIWKNYVRLYFRPRTPTQHENEGFRPKSFRDLDAHCPVPVYFLFDSKKLLTRQSVMFSKKSLAITGTEVFSDFANFSKIPFDLVYHDKWFPPEERDMIVQHRHAEVVVPKELNLEDLRYIWCRSEAEYKTLLNLLSHETWLRWRDKIGSGKKGNFFFRKWFFVESADLSRESIVFHFNLPAIRIIETVGLKLEIHEFATEVRYTWENPEFEIKDHLLTISLINLKSPEHYNVKLYCDNHLLFSDNYMDEDQLPF